METLETMLQTSRGDKLLKVFSEIIIEINDRVGFKVSSRGWAYQLENLRMINKDQFDKVSTLINRCRKKGFLPVDFVAEEDARKFVGVEYPETETIEEYQIGFLKACLDAGYGYTPQWWEGEEYYIQMLVEKIDLKTLFRPVCKKFKIPVATSKGWSSIMQRAEYSRRFKEAEEDGLKCVLLYCGDHDCDGLRISDFLRKNLYDISDIYWNDGTEGYFPDDLIIDRFGLNYDFIMDNNLTWIDNLITGSGKNLADPNHKNFHQDYVQDYLSKYGERKCEANALVIDPKAGRQLCFEAITKYVGSDAEQRFEQKVEDILGEFKTFRDEHGITQVLENVIEDLEDNE